MKKFITLELVELAEYLKGRWLKFGPIQRCNSIASFKFDHRLSERQLAELFKISKSEVHRLLSVAALSEVLKATHEKFTTDYHTLCLYAEAVDSSRREELKQKILDGSILRHKDA